jgi:8-oxo-dGTP diphosphatase
VPDAPTVFAAGGLVWRERAARREILVVHRPKYDDWSLPKGKLDLGEHVLAAAVREIEEETGVPVRLGAPLQSRRYRIAEGDLKEVRFWLARPIGEGGAPQFEANAEVDEVAWIPVQRARNQLTSSSDVDLLSALDGQMPASEPLVVVRHGHALPRKSWTGDDLLRPLGDDGQQQAKRLPALLSAYRVEQVVSSDALRCRQTVQPFLDVAELELTAEHSLAEQAAPPEEVRRLVATYLDDSIPMAVCTHRKVLPYVFAALGLDDPHLEPGGVVVVHRVDGAVLTSERHAP